MQVSIRAGIYPKHVPEAAGIYGSTKQAGPRSARALSMEPVADIVGELPAKKKGSKGSPPGILEHRSGKYQVRLPGATVDGKACQRPIPGLFKETVDALAAQARAAMLLFESGGIQAVWLLKETAPAERNKRGEVRRPATC